MKPAALPAGIDHEFGMKQRRLAVTPPSQRHAVWSLVKTRQFGLVEVFDTEPLGLVDQVVVKVRSKPMRVGDLITWAGGDKQLVSTPLIVAERLAKGMVKKGKPALEAAADFRMFALPLAPAAKRQKLWQVVFLGNLLEKQVGQWRG